MIIQMRNQKPIELHHVTLAAEPVVDDRGNVVGTRYTVIGTQLESYQAPNARLNPLQPRPVAPCGDPGPYTVQAPPAVDGPATAQQCDCVRIVEDACFGAVFVSRDTLRRHRAANSHKYPFTAADGPSDAVVDECLAARWLEPHLRRGKSYVGLSPRGRKWRQSCSGV